MKALKKKKKKKKNKFNAIEQIFIRSLKKLEPPEDISVAEWSEKYRILSPECSAEPGKWKHYRAPYLQEIMECFTDDSVKEIVVMSCAQVGKSEILNNTIGYIVDIDPAPTLMLQPSIKMAEDYSKDRIFPMIRDCQKLWEKIDLKTKSNGNTILHKVFPGGHLTLAGSNSPSQLASRPIKNLLIDEVDRMETTSEGDPVSIAEKRTATFSRRKIVKVSTPTIKDVSRIERSYNRSDKRKQHIKCEKCSTWQVVKWSEDTVVWDHEIVEGKKRYLPETARYVCINEKCKHEMYDGERWRVLQSAKWIAEEPFRGVAGFQLNELCSQFRKLSEIVSEFIDKKDNPDELMVFVNTVLGETFEIVGDAPDWEVLYRRRESYPFGSIPKGGLFLTGGADVQSDRIHVEIVAWGRNFETWSVEYVILHGDTTQSEVWDKLDRLVCKTWKNHRGASVGLRKFCIDSGHNTAIVQNWCRKYSRSKVVPVFGNPGQRQIIGSPGRVDAKKGKNHKISSMNSYPVGVDKAKSELFGFLRQKEPLEKDQGFPFGFCHFPEYDQDFFLELTAEEQHKEKDKKGYYKYIWKKKRERNEALDCRVYNRAASCLAGIDRFDEQRWIEIESECDLAISKKGKLTIIKKDSGGYL